MQKYIKILTISTFFLNHLETSFAQAKAIRSTPKKEETREIDPTYILGALSGAVSAVAERKQEKHPHKIHPISVIATILDQTAKLVHQNILEQEKKQAQRSFTKEDISKPLSHFLAVLNIEYKDSKVMKKITKHTSLLEGYFNKTEKEKEAYLNNEDFNIKTQKKLLGEALFAAGNFVAEKAQGTAQECAENLVESITTKKSISLTKNLKTKSILSSEAQLLEMISLLLVDHQDLHKGEVIEIEMVDHLVGISTLVKNILSREPNLLSFWQETPMIGSLIKAESETQRQELIAQYLKTKEEAVSFVQELVYCIYHIVFDRLGQMLTVAYQIIQAPELDDEVMVDPYGLDSTIIENADINKDELEKEDYITEVVA